MSEVVISNTWALGTVLSAFLIVLYTTDYHICDKDQCAGCGFEEGQSNGDPCFHSGVQCGHCGEVQVYIDNKLDMTENTEALQFRRRLRTFNICCTNLRMFYESVVASSILLCVWAAGFGLLVLTDPTN